MTSGLKEDLAELCGCRLACDCPAQSPCEADVLAGGLTFTHVVCNGQDQAKPKAKRRKQPEDDRLWWRSWVLPAFLLQSEP